MSNLTEPLKADTRTVTLTMRQFIEIVDNAGADAPVWALELAWKLGGPK